jgi:hypothetical protein
MAMLDSALSWDLVTANKAEKDLPAAHHAYQVIDVIYAQQGRAMLVATTPECAQPVLIDRAARLTPARQQRLQERAAILPTLAHPHLARALKVFIAEGAAHVMMVAGAGLPLTDHVGTATQRDAVQWAIQICDALGYLAWRAPDLLPAHLEPRMFFVTTAGRLKLSGMLDLLRLETPRVPGTATLGRRHAVAVAGMVVALLTGTMPTLTKQPSEGTVRDFTCSDELRAVLTHAFAPTPKDRFPTLAALRYALLPLVGR